MSAQNKGFTKISLRSLGFTLVELMVVISIIAILAVIGLIIFTNVQKSARDSRRKEDVSSIASAYEVGYSNNGSYTGVQATNFSAKAIPKVPEGTPAPNTTGDYYNYLANDHSGYLVCAALENHPSRVCNTPSSTCYCKTSAQGVISSTSTGPDTLASTNYQYGYAGSGLQHPASCDPNGTLDDGLVGYWKFNDGGTGGWTGVANDVKDSSNTLSHGQSFNGPTLVAGLVTSQSNFGTAGSFDGVNDYISMGDDTDLRLTSAGTVSAWINPISYATASTWNVILNKGSWGSGKNYYSIYYSGATNLRLDLGDATTTYNIGLPNTVTQLNNWSHVLLRWSNNTMDAFVNGVKTSRSSGVPDTSTYPFVISTDQNGGHAFNGKIDDVRVYNRALSDPEVAALWNSPGLGCIP